MVSHRLFKWKQLYFIYIYIYMDILFIYIKRNAVLYSDWKGNMKLKKQATDFSSISLYLVG